MLEHGAIAEEETAEGRPSEDRCLRLVGIDRPCRAEARREGAGKVKRKETEGNELERGVQTTSGRPALWTAAALTCCKA